MRQVAHPPSSSAHLPCSFMIWVPCWPLLWRPPAVGGSLSLGPTYLRMNWRVRRGWRVPIQSPCRLSIRMTTLTQPDNFANCTWNCPARLRLSSAVRAPRRIPSFLPKSEHTEWIHSRLCVRGCALATIMPRARTLLLQIETTARPRASRMGWRGQIPSPGTLRAL